jgi:hypothetical protein
MGGGQLLALLVLVGTIERQLCAKTARADVLTVTHAAMMTLCH